MEVVPSVGHYRQSSGQDGGLACLLYSHPKLEDETTCLRTQRPLRGWGQRAALSRSPVPCPACMEARPPAGTGLGASEAALGWFSRFPFCIC